MTLDFQTEVGKAVPILDALEKFAPFLSSLLALTPAAVAGPILTGLIGAIDEGAKAVAAGHNGDAVDIVAGLTKQMIPGFQNVIAGAPAAPAAVAPAS